MAASSGREALILPRSSPEANWAYYDTAQKKSFIWDGAAWRVIAQDGDAGSFLVWKGALSMAPENPEANWAYYDIARKASFVWDGNAWKALSQGGFGTPIFMRVAELSSWLAAQNGGNTASDPVFAVYAGNETPGRLYDALDAAKKYVSLDLSMSDIIEFASGIETGRNYIVALNLPKECTVADGTRSDPAFKHFGNLASVTGGINACFGAYAFAGLTSLRSVNLSTNEVLGTGVFTDCINLYSVEFPRLQHLQKNTFAGCASLASVSLPKVGYVEAEAFSGCTGLASIVIPKVSTIQSKAFKDCIKLASLTVGGSFNSFWENAFSGTARTVRTVTVYVPSDIKGRLEASHRFGVNSIIGYFWDSDSPYRDNLTLAIEAIP